MNVTDHFPIMISIGNLSKNRMNKPNPLKILKTDKLKLNNLIQTQNWSNLLEITDTNIATHYFTETINRLKNQASSEITINSKTKKLKPWASTSLINSIRQRDHLHLQIRKHLLNSKFKEYYLKFRNKTT